jgi:NADH:ubiquinone oxidoreductase subunit 5 (subunit L)/multisubunit Na+/H+ antiporter MnhA subunit
MLRRWPALGALTIGGGMAIAAVPGLSGFVGEWLIFLALFESALTLAGGARVVALIAIVAVAITAAFTVACYVRLLGIGLLGARRGGEPAGSHAAPGRATIVPLAVLAALCVLAAWFPQGLAHALAGPVRLLVPRGDSAAPAESLRPLGALSIALAGVVTLFAAARAALMRRGPRRASVTWDCGYAHPDPRMQYTASSLSQPVSGWFAPVLQTRIEAHGLSGPWPSDASWRSRTADQAMTGVYQPALGGVSRMLLGLRDLQQPDVTSYLRYVGLALLVALALLFLPIVARP